MLRRLVPALFVLAVLATAVVVAIAAVLSNPRVERRSSADALTGITWHWTSTTVGAPVTTVTPDPTRYTVEFDPDGTIRATADCTTVSGTFRLIPGGRMGPQTGLEVTLGPTGLASCGAGSLAGAYVAGLEASAAFQVVEDRLTIGLAAGGSMTFR